MEFTYKHTKYACYLSYICSAVINNFAPLLFVIFQKQFGISLGELSVLIVLNFGTQLVVDFFGAKYADRLGYRKSITIGLFSAFLGLLFMGVLSNALPAYPALIISVIFYAIGSGLIEVLVSPMIEALPADSKASSMAFLHSFYCWGSVLVVLASTLFFKLIGIENWRVLCCLWAVLPLVACLAFTKVPIVHFGDGESSGSFKNLFKSGIFWLFNVLMISAGAAELSVSQWVSLFAETGLGVSKTVGDVLGPCMFGVMMGISRIIYGKYSEKYDLFSALFISSGICITGYLITVFSKNPIISLCGCGISGFGAAVMWPGTLSLAAKFCSFGGTAVFGLLAMSGDIGCSVGPAVVAKISSLFSIMGSELKAGLFCAAAFPLVMLIGVGAMKVFYGKK